MYYNIRNSLGITALALIIAAAAGQPAYAQLPNSGAANALPSEITLGKRIFSAARYFRARRDSLPVLSELMTKCFLTYTISTFRHTI